MNNMIKKLILLILIFIIVLIGINIYTSLINTHSKEYESDIISKSNAKTLEIYNHRITNLSERSGNDVTAIVKMKNTSYISSIGVSIFTLKISILSASLISLQNVASLSVRSAGSRYVLCCLIASSINGLCSSARSPGT